MVTKCKSPSLFRFGSQHRGVLLRLAVDGSADWSDPKRFIERQLTSGEHPPVVEYEPGRYALNAYGAEVAFHAYDNERGVFQPMHEGWATNREARESGLPTYTPPTVLYWDGTQISTFHHSGE